MSQNDLRTVLAECGPLRVDEFMAWCLTGRPAAYYRSAEPIGRAGDFITAPEISQIFGELAGLWMGAVWLSMGRPAPVVIAELGPGRGTLMSDAMRALRVVPGFIEAAQLHLVERSQPLRRAQAASLGTHAPTWHAQMQTVPEGPLILVANEFFDALPIAQFVHRAGSWHERVVRLDAHGDPAFAVGEPAVLPATLSPPGAPPEGAVMEARPAAQILLGDIGRRARSAPTAALILDYGYGQDAFGDTLQAVRAHGYDDPLAHPGESDLSAHVNFAELARMAAASGLAAWGPLPQGDFLLALGLEARLQRLISLAREDQRATLMLGARRLVDPFQMGSLFKAMALTSPGLDAPPPFAEAANAAVEPKAGREG